MPTVAAIDWLPTTRKSATLTLLLAIVYVGAARLGLALDAVAGFATLVWPPTGISLAVVLLFGYRLWPGVFVGAAVANLLVGAPPGVALGIAVGNTAEALLGTYLLRGIPDFHTSLDNVRDVFGLIVAVLLSTMVSATIGIASLSAGGIVAPAQFAETWRAWWVGDLMGALLVAPIILVWSSSWRGPFAIRWGEVTALAAAAVLVSVATFFADASLVGGGLTRHAYVLFPVMIWAAVRFGQRGATSAAFVVSAIAVWGTARGSGPFVRAELHESLLALQIFMAIVATTFLFLGAAIAERRRAEVEARLAQEDAARANLAKAEFLAVMSHELRTPLNAISGYIDLFELGALGDVGERQKDAIRRVRRNQTHLLSLIDDVLSFARVETGQLTIESERVCVSDAFDTAETIIQPELRRKNFLFKRLPVERGLEVHADPKKLQQILLNLLGNAAKYTHHGGTISIGAERRDGTVTVRVQDSGIGIAGEHLDRVFEPFFQAERGTTRRYPGIGLGLTIARDLARRMEGDVTLASTLGAGTTATLTLPSA